MKTTPGYSPAIAAIVLAAGTSSRMGAHKLLLPLGDRPIIAHVLAAALASSAKPVFVVLGRDAERVAAALPHDNVTTVENAAYASGMASSLRAGIAAVPTVCAGALMLLGDQPLVSAALIERILAEARTHPTAVIAAAFDGKRGHPVYFPRRLFTELAVIEGDEGGRSVIARHADALILVAWPEATAGLDLDTEDDYAHLQSVWNAQAGGATR